jgi:adenosine/AMP kinase
MEIKVVKIDAPEGCNIILGQLISSRLLKIFMRL